jgi:23S rRNA (uracil1939-C5)-methyltransferase
MSRSTPAESAPFEIRIEKVVFGGAGLGRHEGQVVFVPFSAPGDLLLVKPIQKKKNLIKAEIVKILEAGEGRAEPRCSHFGRCGGCHWQHLDYKCQVEAKRSILEETIRHRFPQAKSVPITMLASPRDFGYRSRARLQVRGFGPQAVVGFFHTESHIVEDIQACPLLLPLLSDAIPVVRKSLHGMPDNPGGDEIEIAASTEENRWESARSFSGSREKGDRDARGRREIDSGLLTRTAGDFSYRFSPSSFFQANDAMLDELIAAVAGLFQNSPEEDALDLYGGVGLFALPLARKHLRVVSVEASRAAGMLCLENATNAGLNNIRTVCGDVGKWMRAVGSVAPPAYDTVVLDPPRTGAGRDVMDWLKQWAPRKIIYVSCDVQTLCRDLAWLTPGAYAIDRVQGLDLFPQTYHFETVVRLIR